MYKSYTKYTEQDLFLYGIQTFRRRGDEVEVHCVFNDCDKDSIGQEAHLSINFKKGVYHCYKCGANGHITELFKYINSFIKYNGKRDI